MRPLLAALLFLAAACSFFGSQPAARAPGAVTGTGTITNLQPPDYAIELSVPQHALLLHFRTVGGDSCAWSEANPSPAMTDRAVYEAAALKGRVVQIAAPGKDATVPFPPDVRQDAVYFLVVRNAGPPGSGIAVFQHHKVQF